MPYELDIALRLVVASMLGGLVGLEREIHGREAGVRTYLLVSLGSALIMVVSEYLLLKYQGTPAGEFVRSDPSRIPAQAITGMGFLGAGVIIRYHESIRGLTTAACMWVVCAIGLAVGSGYYLFGSLTTGITLLSLVGLKMVDRNLSKDWYKEIIIVSKDVEGQYGRIQEIIDKYGIKITNFGIKKNFETEEITLIFRFRLRTVRPDPNILKEVFKIEGIKQINLR